MVVIPGDAPGLGPYEGLALLLCYITNEMVHPLGTAPRSLRLRGVALSN